MIVVPPFTLSPLTVTVTGVGFPDATQGEVAWSSATTYNLGDQVVSSITLRRYVSSIASNLNHVLPTVAGQSNTQWQDNGYVNRFASIDYTNNRQCISDTGPLQFVVQGQQILNVNRVDARINTIAAIDISADFVELVVKDGNGVTLYDKTETMFSRTVEDWFDYFYAKFVYRKNALFANLPQAQTNQFYLTLSNSGAAMTKCGSLVMGQATYLGETQYDPTISTINYSTITADAFGNTVLIPRRSVPNNTVATQIPAINVDEALAIKDQLNAVAALWSGLDDDTQPYFGSLLLFGVYTQFDIDPFSIDYATVTLQLQGL